MSAGAKALRRLCAASLADARPGVGRPGYDRAATRIGIVHFGPGAFHRAHQAWYVDRLLASDPRWGICAVSLQSPAARDALAPQDFLYTLAELGPDTRLSIIGALRELKVSPRDREAILARLVSPDVRFATLTVTEKGYCLDARGSLDEGHPAIAHDLAHPREPVTVIGWLAEGLRERRARGVPPFAVVSCDNLQDNGPTLRRALTSLVHRLDSGLARWIEEEVAFPRTMVDSITPATDDRLRARVATAIGLEDAWPVQREVFTQWVIEDLPAVRVADWESVGVTLTADVAVYDRAKLRLVNGAHSTLAYLGLLRGRETVSEAMSDAPLAEFVERLMREDIAPTLSSSARGTSAVHGTSAVYGASSGLDVPAYIGAVLARFRNPAMRHLLAQIAWDGSKKLPVRLIGTIEDRLRAGGSIERLVVPVAAWMRFIARQAKAGAKIVDPDAERLAAIGRACTGEARADIERFVALDTVIAPAVATHEHFSRPLERAYARLAAADRLERFDSD
ncbi:MAG TPA: mannitol dehydrogenase family protein [Steroidobacteraceae bacterium]